MKKRREFIETDLTSLIDVVFLLLIFFMATTVFKKEELVLGLTLPMTQTGTASKEENKALKLSVSKEEFSFNNQILSLEEMTKQVMQIQNKKIAVELRVDKDVEYQRLIDVLNLLKAHKIFNIDLITQKK
jgi:biopolymer transport protein ExbD